MVVGDEGIGGVPSWPAGVVAADAGLYRRNAFRVGGLPVTATPRQVRRRGEEVRAAEALGVEAPPGAAPWLPLRPAPDYAAVREALRRLDDPVARVADEFFWIWPLPGDREREREREGGGDGDPVVWERLARSPADEACGVAIHNLAVLRHAELLEGRRPVVGSAQRHRQWRRAYQHWRRVLRDEGCWRRVEGRIAALDDPRLRAVSAAALREALPGLLLAVHARLAVGAAEGGAETVARQHVALMREFDPGGGAGADAVLREATAPIAARIRLRAARGGDPAALDTAAGTLLAESAPEVRLLSAVLGQTHPVAESAADEVAAAALSCVISAANAPRPGEAAPPAPRLRELTGQLRAAREIAATPHARASVERNLAVLLTNVVGVSCQEAVEEGERAPDGGAAHAERLLAEAEPLLRELGELRGLAVPEPGEAEIDQAHDAVAAAACQLLTVYFNATHDAPRALAGFRTALPLAVGAEGRSAIQQNIEVLAELTPGAGRRAAPPAPPPAPPAPTAPPPVRVSRVRGTAARRTPRSPSPPRRPEPGSEPSPGEPHRPRAAAPAGIT
jgi:hypothetical protein